MPHDYYRSHQLPTPIPTPMPNLDDRIVKLNIEVNGVIKTYSSPLNIIANGTKYGNALQNEAEITLSNLDRSTQDYIVTETSPYNLNKTAKTISVEAGRVSYGTSIIYRGNIVSVTVTQPPDIGIIMKCLTGNFAKGNVISRNQPGTTTFKQASAAVAQDLNLQLNFQATDKNISNYAYSGGALQQVQVLNGLGNYNAFIDNDVLIVKDAFIPLNGTNRILSAETGMIGIPEFTEQGIKVKMLLDNQTTLGSQLTINSVQYPAANGQYVIYKLGFEIASRDIPFYYIAEAARRR